MTVKQIIKAIKDGNFTQDELREINGAAVDEINREVKNQISAAKDGLKIGMEVTVDHPKLKGRNFELVSIKRTKAVVKAFGETFGGYTVPIHLVKPA